MTTQKLTAEAAALADLGLFEVATATIEKALAAEASRDSIHSGMKIYLGCGRFAQAAALADKLLKFSGLTTSETHDVCLAFNFASRPADAYNLEKTIASPVPEWQIPKEHSFFAIISDIHANIDALDAVFSDMECFPIRGILCLGDIVGYGPEPAACVQRVMDTCAVSVFGNHEAMLFLAEQFPPEEMLASVGDPITLAFEQVSEDQMKWLRGLPISADLDPMMLSHAALNDIGSFHYIHGEDEAKAHFAVQTTFVSFHGHTHVPLIWEEKQDGHVACFKPPDKPVHLDKSDRYAINVGSVGQTRDNDPHACYVLYDYQSRLLLHRRVEYDIRKAQARFKNANLPAFNASRLKKGH